MYFQIHHSELCLTAYVILLFISLSAKSNNWAPLGTLSVAALFTVWGLHFSLNGQPVIGQFTLKATSFAEGSVCVVTYTLKDQTLYKPVFAFTSSKSVLDAQDLMVYYGQVNNCVNNLVHV